MGFSELELRLIDSTVGAMCRRRSPSRLAGEVRVVYEVDGHSVTVIEERSPWEGESEWTRMPSARFRYFRTRGTWTLYWMRRDRKWHTYDPETPERDLATLAEVVDEDYYGAFFG